MASIKKRPNGMWRARYRDEADRERARHFARKSDAQKWLDEVTASIVRGDYVDPNAAKTVFKVYAKRWEANQVVGESRARSIDNALRVHVVPVLGEKQLGKILRSDIQGLVKGLVEKELAAGTIRNIYEITQRVFADAVEDRLISSTPCRRIALPSGEGKKVVPPTLEEIAKVRKALPDRFGVLPLFLAGTGMRIGEALALEVHGVNWLRGTVAVELQRLQSGALSATKTPASVDPSVPIPHEVLVALRAHVKAHTPGDGPLFPDEFGAALGYRRWKALFNAAKEEAGVGWTTHDLRHFAASAALAGGASIVEVQHLLRHASATITLRTYSHLMPSSDERIRNALNAALIPVPVADRLRTEGDVHG